jgi:hypothetical protein
MGEPGAASVVTHPHTSAFHGNDTELIEMVAPYVVEGLDHGERVVVVITDPHRAALDEALHERGIDSTRARRSGTYLPWGAAETLQNFYVDGSMDRDRFVGTVGGLLGTAPDAAPVRAFGEMVALLWERGDVAAALELEDLWSEFLRTRPFSLMCAYSTASLSGALLSDVGRLCEVHGTLLAPSGYADLEPGSFGPRAAAADTLWSDIFLPVPSAAAAARHFVTAALAQWGEDDLQWEAALVASELATNAVRHGASPFRASVSRAGGPVRIAVEDVAPGRPERRAATRDLLDGRGVAIVEALTRRSGCDVLPDSKVVWAELSRGPRRAG